MLRFTIRDLLWLAAVLGLAATWWHEIEQRQRESAELERLQAVLDDQAMDFQSLEQYLLDKDEAEGRRLLADWAQRYAEKQEADAPQGGPAAALAGQWEVVERISRGQVEDLAGQPSSRIRFDRRRISFLNHREPDLTCRFTVTAREIDVTFGLDNPDVFRGLYELNDGKLRIVSPNDVNKPRPMDFDALNNNQLTLEVLKKVK